MIPEHILALDANDCLASKRLEFELPENTIYLDGNSLGPLTLKAKTAIDNLLSHQWGKDLIGSWNKHNWIDLPLVSGEKIARLIGAAEGQVVCCDSTSINLFKALASALNLNQGRTIVLSQSDNFPTDLYMAQGLSGLLGEHQCQLKQVKARHLVDSLDESVAVLMLTQVNFRSGALHNMQVLTELAHDKGILVIWDLAHSAGALPLNVDAAKIDFAVGCGYKYLNGGPGASAFIYVARRHLERVSQPLSGWMGHRKPFAFDSNYQADDGIKQYQSGTPSILSLVALNAALDVFTDVDMQQLRTKSIALSELFIQCLNGRDSDLELISPTDPLQRGSQLAFRHSDAFAISQALIAQKIIVDFRAPDIVRFGFTPLYLRFVDVWRAAQAFVNIVQHKTFQNAHFQERGTVT